MDGLSESTAESSDTQSKGDEDQGSAAKDAEGARDAALVPPCGRHSVTYGCERSLCVLRLMALASDDILARWRRGRNERRTKRARGGANPADVSEVCADFLQCACCAREQS